MVIKIKNDASPVLNHVSTTNANYFTRLIKSPASPFSLRTEIKHFAIFVITHVEI